MEEKIDIHVIRGVNTYVALDTESLRLFRVNKNTADCIDAVMMGINNLGDLVEVSSLTPVEVQDLLNRLEGLKSQESQVDSSLLFPCISREIDRITLHVSNDCNLRCRYCYASGGGYKGVRKLMSMNTAKDFIHFVEDNLSRLSNLVFFGGEPFMNAPVIDYICRSLSEMYERNSIPYLPSFGAITNGYFTDDRIFDLIRRYFTFLTVSIDGDEYGHNLNRVSKDGRGSFRTVAKFIDRVKAIPDLHVTYEATYTTEHIKHKISRQDIKTYLDSRFGISGVICDEYSLEYSSMHDLTSEGLFLARGEASEYVDLIPLLRHEAIATMCPIGRGTIAVDASGGIFPCHMDVNNIFECLGNVSSSNVYTSPNEYINSRGYLTKSLKDNACCRSCWVRGFCGGCTRLWFYNSDEKCYKETPDASSCENYKKHVERGLLQIASKLCNN